MPLILPAGLETPRTGIPLRRKLHALIRELAFRPGVLPAGRGAGGGGGGGGAVRLEQLDPTAVLDHAQRYGAPRAAQHGRALPVHGAEPGIVELAGGRVQARRVPADRGDAPAQPAARALDSRPTAQLGVVRSAGERETIAHESPPPGAVGTGDAAVAIGARVAVTVSGSMSKGVAVRVMLTVPDPATARSRTIGAYPGRRTTSV